MYDGFYPYIHAILCLIFSINAWLRDLSLTIRRKRCYQQKSTGCAVGCQARAGVKCNSAKKKKIKRRRKNLDTRVEEAVGRLCVSFAGGGAAGHAEPCQSSSLHSSHQAVFCCWPTEATSAGLDGPRGAPSTEARWLARCLTEGESSGGGGGDGRPHRAGPYPMAVCVCVGACVFVVAGAWTSSKRTWGTKQSSQAIIHSLSKSRPGRKREWRETVSIISPLSKLKSRTSAVMIV